MTQGDARIRRDAPPPDATAVPPADVFGPGSRAHSNFRRSVVTVDRVGIDGSERDRASLRRDVSSDSRQEHEDPEGCPRMAQNVNPFSAMQNTPTKAAEEKQSLPKDNHAVSKRYAGSSPLASIASRPGPPSNPDRGHPLAILETFPLAGHSPRESISFT